MAKKAHRLLEEKYKILMQEMKGVKEALFPFEEGFAQETKRAYSLLSKAIISLGIRNVYSAALSTQPNDEIDVEWGLVRGVTVPRITAKVLQRTPLQRGYNITETNFILDQAAGALEKNLQSLLSLADLRNIVQMLEKEAKRTRVRVSALEKVLIPSLEREIRMVERKLDEVERESHSTVRWLKEFGATSPPS
jgi:V/A-type H+-transporting ATPase subunit D